MGPTQLARVRQIIKSLNIAGLEGAPETKVSRVRLVDIARLAGVSTTTVSRVLNRKPDVDSFNSQIYNLAASHLAES